MFNSREAIAEAIIGHRLVFFSNSKNLNCMGRCLFLRLEEEYWRSPFYYSKNLLQIKEVELYSGVVFFYDSKRSIGFLKVFTTRRGVLVFLRFFFTGSAIRSDAVLT